MTRHGEDGPGQGLFGIGSRIPFRVQGPPERNGLALALGGDDVAPGHHRGGEIDFYGIALPGGERDRQGIGAEKCRTRPAGAMDDSTLVIAKRIMSCSAALLVK